MPFVSVNKNSVITAVSERPFAGLVEGCRTIKLEGNHDPKKILGRRISEKKDKLRLAVLCNWGQECGISTYTGYLIKSLRPHFSEVKIFSEEGGNEPGVEYCWKRGSSMHTAIQKLMEWKPDFVMIQHEFGLFPKATYLLQMLQMLDSVPYLVVLHSTYEHLDKSICTAAMKNILVHTDEAKGVLRRLGNTSKIDVIPHGCVTFTAEERKENWNIFQTPHVIMQFGFGFQYKGVDRAIDAVSILKERNPEKYKDIFYVYLCSENPHNKNIHNEYLGSLTAKVEKMGLQDNVVIIKKYHSDQEINNYLRTAKLAIFPYLINPGNTVYGASGAIRIAMANGIPVLASESHLFDSLPVPRPSSSAELAEQIDRIFSDWKHRDSLVKRQDDYVLGNSWSKVAASYSKLMWTIYEDNFLVV